ncbi:hypothetical protein H5410_027115 [Solanum commersonii]|uniref:Uncharacterized protein n=1 Tax=Solanum commersonii TaxID=4109 RepID=A0A9J5Z121_SOLCO|nr:hypothetical protein H5410_027115 [Solanum commersonii]
MVPISSKGKEKVTEETPKIRSFIRSDSKKLMGDTMKSSITTTVESRKKRKLGNVLIGIPDTDVVDVSIEDSEHEGVEKSSEEKGKKQKVLGGRVFDPDIITKHGMNSLCDLMEIQSWTHLFQIKSLVLHEEEVREFYYNIEFEEDGSINTRVGDKSLHLTEDLLG